MQRSFNAPITLSGSRKSFVAGNRAYHLSTHPVRKPNDHTRIDHDSPVY